MSIERKQHDYLWALPVQRAELPDVPYVTLTELACCAIYGAPLTSGLDGSYAKLKSARRLTQLMLREPSSESSSVEIIFGAEPAPIDIPSRIEALAAEVAGEPQERLLPLMHGFVQTGEKIERVLEWILIHHHQFEDQEMTLAKRSRRFYRQLSHGVAGGKIVLLGKRRLGAHVTDPSHEPIDAKFFVGKKVHDLDANELSEPGSPNVLPAIGGNTQTRVPDHLSWIDVKVSQDHANMLLHEFISMPEAADMQEPSTLQKWNPTWFSLAGAVMWAITRDKHLAMDAERYWQDAGGCIRGICAQLAYRKVTTGWNPKYQLEIGDAWPALRRLIADEKIVAEGRSIERRGLDGRLETIFPSLPIPSGDAGNLFIDSDVRGIAPKDALAPDEFYRFHGGQGRYWYDVRLKASDVFRELPAVAAVEISAVAATAAAEAKCRQWLAGQMRVSPERRPKSKAAYYKEACTKFEIGSPESKKPSRAFIRAWEAAMEEVGCVPVWARAGAPKKSPQ